MNQDVLLASPGGMASTTHHWTGGFYGKGGSNTDKFTGQNNNPYPSGEFGNMYSDRVPPDLNDSFEVLPFTKLDDPVEGSIPPEYSDEEGSKKAPAPRPLPKVSFHGKQVSLVWAVGLTVALILIYFVLSLWTTLGMRSMNQIFGNGGPLTMKTLLFVSIAGTFFMIFFTWILGVSFISILQPAE
jgi:hypothetical protein